MTMLGFIIFIIVFAAMNRARGTQFFDCTGSTTLGRLLSTFFMALAVMVDCLPMHQEPSYIFFLAWLLLYGWTILKWDAYWSAAIGNDPAHSKLWGIGMMTLRQGLLLPYYCFLAGLSGYAWHLAFSASVLLLGVTYYLSGRYTPGSAVIRNAEIANGAIMGATSWLILHGISQITTIIF